jgi:hypothetical protein
MNKEPTIMRENQNVEILVWVMMIHNGHRSRVEPIELAENMRSIIMEVHSYRDEN